MSSPNPLNDPSTTVVHRPFGGVDGYRCAVDRASRVVVHAFPLSELPALAASGLLAAPGAYVLADDALAYVGESLRPARRLADHSADPTKFFARDAIVISGIDGAPFDKGLLLDLQFRLARTILEIGARSICGACPTEIDVAAADKATADRMFADALRLTFDAGCRFLHHAKDPSGSGEDRLTGPDEGEDAGPISIGVSTTPIGMSEFELNYDTTWARGYWATDGHFIVAAGSEVRAQTNASCDPHTRKRRDDLAAAGVLAAIPGIDDRRRLVTAVSFPSASIAAKAVSGAHTAGRWLPLERSAVVIVGGLRQAWRAEQDVS